MLIKLRDFKELWWHAAIMKVRLFHFVDGKVNVENLELLWETKKPNDWTDIGGKKYDNYYVQEIQANEYNTIDILISKDAGKNGDSTC